MLCLVELDFHEKLLIGQISDINTPKLPQYPNAKISVPQPNI